MDSYRFSLCDGNKVPAKQRQKRIEHYSQLLGITDALAQLDGWTLLTGKLLFHVLATVPVGVIMTLALGIAYGISPLTLLFLVLYAAAIPVLGGILGLLTGLLFPRFDWLNEAYPCKQSIGVMITMFGMMGMSFVSMGMFLLGLWMASGSGMGAAVTTGAALAAVLPVLLSGILFAVLKRWGKQKMEQLLQG